MASEADQVAAQGLASREEATLGSAAPPAPAPLEPASKGSAAPLAPSVSEEMEGTAAPGEAQETKPTDDKPAEDKSALEKAPGNSADLTMVDKPPAEATPAGDLANGNKPGTAPEEPLEMTGALQDKRAEEIPGGPAPPAADDAKTNGGAATEAVETKEAPATEEGIAAEAAGATPAQPPAVEAAAPAPAPEEGVESSQPGDKRKAEDEKPANGEVTEKKAKIDEAPASNGTDTNGTRKKPGRPKKSKEVAPAPVGRTARKTRSQGPVES